MSGEENVTALVNRLQPILAGQDMNDVVGALTLLLSHSIKISGANPQLVIDYINTDMVESQEIVN